MWCPVKIQQLHSNKLGSYHVVDASVGEREFTAVYKDVTEAIPVVTFISQIHILSLVCASPAQLFDTDEDEKITREEFTALLRSALGVSDLNMTKLFKEIDADCSGFITFSE